jgi:glycosyltransferase involved in cell wall biosynthesis
MKVNLCLMAKNEEKTICKTIDSVVNTLEKLGLPLETIIVLDTGSTDNTVSLIKDTYKNYRLIVFVEEFIDFSISRNELLDYAYDMCGKEDYLLLLDCNDELKISCKSDPEYNIKTVLESKIYDAILIKHNFYSINSSTNEKNVSISFPMITFIKNGCGLYYEGVVHEQLAINKNTKLHDGTSLDVIVEQDRSIEEDNKKTKERLHTDIEKLLITYNTYNKNYKEKDNYEKLTRTVFYIAQTYLDLKMYEEAFKFYKKRVSLDKYMEYESFSYNEEVYQSYLKLIELAMKQNKETEGLEYLKQSLLYTNASRMESFILYSKYNEMKGNYQLAYSFMKKACEFSKPSSLNGMQINDYVYDNYRFEKLDYLKSKI